MNASKVEFEVVPLGASIPPYRIQFYTDKEFVSLEWSRHTKRYCCHTYGQNPCLHAPAFMIGVCIGFAFSSISDWLSGVQTSVDKFWNFVHHPHKLNDVLEISVFFIIRQRLHNVFSTNWKIYLMNTGLCPCLGETWFLPFNCVRMYVVYLLSFYHQLINMNFVDNLWPFKCIRALDWWHWMVT